MFAPLPEDNFEPRARVQSLTLFTLSLFALASLLAQAGFGADGGLWLALLDGTVAAAFVAVWVAEIAGAKSWRQALRSRRVELMLVAGTVLTIALLSLLASDDPVPSLAPLLTVIRVFLLACLVVQSLRQLERVLARGMRAEILLGGTFVLLIALSTLLLLLPRTSAKQEAPIGWVDAVFTATSAACVTGLGVRDTGTDFTTFGQMVILATIQIGGLGIITFVALLSSLSKRSLPVPQMVIFRQMINAPDSGDLRQRVAGIFAITLAIEAAGAAALYAMVAGSANFADDVKWAAFHSVSAFCNAGFSLERTSLEAFRTDPGINLVIMALIVLGGLGFLVIPELCMVGWRKVAPLLPIPKLKSKEVLWPRLSNQTRFSLWITAALLVLGTLGFWAVESGGCLRGEGVGDSLLISAFQSVTARTAGFNTLPMGELSNAALILLVFLMVIGGCPVSTAGGIKTVTFAVLLMSLRGLVMGREKIEAFGRALPARAVIAALNVLVLYLLSAVFGLMALTLTDPAVPLRDLGFETFSALSTVGLSTGITASLSDSGKLILCALMFIGRVGPLAMVLSVFHARHNLDYDFPDEDVVVG